jgi:hypothetical protein
MTAAILSTLGFSCYNEPHYERVGMSNPPGGSGAAPGPIGTAPPVAATTPPPAPSAGTAKRP